MDLASLPHGSAPKPYTEAHGNRSAPLSPSSEGPRCSLPSMSDLLKGSEDHAANDIKLPNYVERQRLSPQHAYALQFYVRKPNTPPLRPDCRSGQVSPSPKGYRSSVFPINSNPQMGLYASLAPSMPSFSSHTSQPLHHHQPTQSTSPISLVTPALQHTNYLPPASAGPYRRNHICTTCHKAFVCRSELEIHSHSHTGEKPFRCTHSSCGKDVLRAKLHESA
ncbi:hypothetical protein N7523_005748 [Penicillium sp. IBT 18751x]|nr:hypothetical protein N7523_005748 [Penicillium sp. IBT 18751x]